MMREYCQCDICGNYIMMGDEYAFINGSRFHPDCLMEIDRAELLCLLDVLILTAYEDEFDIDGI